MIVAKTPMGNIPKNCWDNCCAQYIIHGYAYCGVNGLDCPNDHKKKPDWCPLFEISFCRNEVQKWKDTQNTN